MKAGSHGVNDYFSALYHEMNYILVLMTVICLMVLAAYAARGYEIRNL